MQISHKQPLDVGSAFSGIGAWEKALTNLKIPHKLKFYFEIDPHASTAYSAVHRVPETLNHKDITKANPDVLSAIDLFVYSPPCQSYSQAGQQAGFDDPRGVLFFDALRIIKAKQPKIALMENVKGLTQSKFSKEFTSMLESLTKAGYNNYYKVLNAKDYGTPQNRDRVFIVSIRKDIDDGLYTLPPPRNSDLRLKDFLDEEVDQKYFVDQARLVNTVFNQVNPANSLLFVGGIGDKKWLEDGKSYSRNYPQGNRIYSTDGIACSQTANGGGLGSNTGLYLTGPVDKPPYPVRKLTPLESWRIMGFNNEDFIRAQEALNKTYYAGKDKSSGKLYKMAGNSIVVSVLEDIFKSILSYLD